MPTENVLVQITTALNAAGIEQAQASFLKLSLSTAALAAGFFVLYEVGKAGIENYKAQEEALNLLNQAVEANNEQVGKSTTTHRDVSKEIVAHNAALRHLAEVEAGMPTKHAATRLQLLRLSEAHQRVTETARELAAAQKPVIENATNETIAIGNLHKRVDDFIAANARFIANQYDVITALASVVRSGESEADAMRILNDALDLSVIKHEDVSVAALLLIKVLAGNSRALKELGITTEQYAAIMNNKLLTTEQKHLALLELIETKTKDGRKTTDEYTQSQNELNKSWQDFTGQTGGPLVGMLTKINQALSTGVQILDLYVQLLAKLAALGPLGPGATAAGSGAPFNPHPSGGSKTATGAGAGGQHINIDLRGAYIDPTGPQVDKLTTAIAQRLRFTTGI